MTTLEPTSKSEAVALFRSQVLGELLHRKLEHGELRAALHDISRRRVMPPDAKVTRTFAVSTLERWYYAYRSGGLAALKPVTRERGCCLNLTEMERQLLLDIRRENPTVATPVILRTLHAEGRLSMRVSAPSVNRLYRQHGLDRASLRTVGRPRLRWEAEMPGTFWHGDVCHGPALVVGGKSKPLRIHALMDDTSRYVLALEAHHTEQEIDMLGLFVRAMRRWGKPEVLYLDNGSTYRGNTLATACGRLDVQLLHARPYDPQARGKMERFWRTLRGQCLGHLGAVTSLHDVNVRLWAYLDRHYHSAAHAGLIGKTPARVWARRSASNVDDDAIRDALTVRERKRIRNDSTLSLGGRVWEAGHGFLAGRTVDVCRVIAMGEPTAWVEYQGHRYELHRVDPVANATSPRPQRGPVQKKIRFQPTEALLNAAVGNRERADD